MRSLLTSALVLALLAPSSVQGQDPAAAVDSLTAQFEATLGRAREFMQTSRQATGEDSLVVVLRVEQEAQRAAQTLKQLSAVLRAEGMAPPLAENIAADFRALVDELWAAEGRVQSRLDLTRQRLFHAEDRSRIRLERELAVRERRLSMIHRELEQVLVEMDLLGMAVQDDRTRLAERIVDRAETLAGRIQLVDQEMEMTRRILESRPGDEEFQQELDMLRRRSQLYIEMLDSAVARLKALGRPSATYQSVLVTHTGEFGRGLLDAGVARTVAQEWWARAKQWLSENGVQIVVRALVFLLVMFLAWGAARVVRRAVKRALDGPRVRVSNLLRKMLIDVSGNLVLLAGLLLALSQVGANLGPVLAGVGVVGFIVGFALQETLANFAAGMMILFYRPYDVGDFVEVSGVFGKVDQMSLVSTTILTIDNQTLVVPNGKIWGDVIRNVTAQRIRRVDLEFGISYSDDIPKAEKILMSILEADDRVLGEPAPMVRLAKLNESSVDFIVRPWVKTDDYWEVFWDVTRQVKLRFDAEGVTIPFPQRDVHHHMSSTAPGPPMPQDGNSRAERGGAGIGADDSTGPDDDD